MRNNKRWAALLLSGAMLLSLAPMSLRATALSAQGTQTLAAGSEEGGCTIIPLPQEYEKTQGSFTLGSGCRFVISGEGANQKVVDSTEVVASEFRKSTGYELAVVQGEEAQSGDIAILVDPSAALEDEGYQLSVTEDGVEITAKNAAGVYYGLQSLRQMFPGQIESDTLVSDVAWTAPCADISDEPTYGYRGMHLDVSRHFFPVEEVKRQIDHMSQYKINKLHMHLSDDQGWRLEIKNNPDVVDKDGNPVDFSNLTELGASTSCDYNGVRAGYYTQEEFKDIVAYAAERNVEIIPEFDMPAHAWAALVSMPMLNSSEDGKPHAGGYDNTKPYQGWDVGWASLECRNENTYIFIDEVFRQLSEISPSMYIHVGGDEAHVTNHDDYVYFVNRVTEIAQKYGKTPIGWQNYDAAVEDKENTITQYWNTGDQRALDGVTYVASPADHAYLDMKYDASCPLGLQWAGYAPVDDAYNWDPTDFGSADQFIGVEGALWAETIADPEHIDYMYYPRLPGIAEVGWTPKENRSWDEYKERIAQHKDRLDSLEIGYKEDTLIWEKPVNFRMPLDEGTGTTVKDTTGDFKGTMVGGVSWGEGRYGSGLVFDGSGYVDLKYNDIGGDWTAGMWVKREDSGAANAALLAGTEGEIKLEQWKNTGKVGLTAYGVDDFTFDYTAPIGEWVHLAFVSNDQGTTLYVNGVETDHIDATINGPVSRIGANYKDGLSDRGYMKGAVDDVQIYDRALSAEEIMEMKEDAFGFENEMIFNFDEGEGTQITDTSGAHSFTLGDGITWTDGKMDSGLDFSGTGRIELGYRDLDKNWSVGLWVNRRESVESNAVLMSGVNGEIKLDQYDKTGKVGVTAYGVEDATFDYAAPMNEWVHLTFVGDETGTTLYVNGVEQDHIDLSINGPANRIGGNISANLADGGYLNAAIDELSVFDRSLTADEVKDLVKDDSEPATDASKALLQKVYDYAAAQDISNLIPTVAAKYQAALDQAQAILGDANATQLEVDKAIEDLFDAVHLLDYTQGDKTALNLLIERAREMVANKDDYMDTNWQMLLDALEKAEAVSADPDALQYEVDDAYAALLEAIEAQQLRCDKSMLELLIDRANGMVENANKYVESNWQQLLDALAKAQAVYDDPNATQTEVETACDELLNAIMAQRFKADKSILEDLINQAESLDLSGYPAEAVATFRTALANAQVVMADNSLSVDDQKTVDNAVAALTAAMDGLTAGGAPETTDKPEASQKPENTDKPQATEKPEKVPQTGDNSGLMLWSLVCLASLAGAGCVVSTKKKWSK